MNMNQREIIIQSINQQIETFTEQFLMAAENGGPIPLIEIDLMKHTVRSLYQQLHELQIISQRPMEPEMLAATTEPVIAKTPITNKVVVEEKTIVASIVDPVVEPTIIVESQPEVIILNDISLAPEEKEEKAEINTIIEEAPLVINVIKEEVINVIEPAAAANNVSTPEVVLNSPSEKVEIIAASVTTNNIVAEEPKKAVVNASLFDDITPTVASKYKEQETLYDKISKNQHSATIAEKLSAKPVIDLRKSIGINERFAFINELFEGNQQLFMESIDKLNNMPKYDEARRVLYEELAGKMNWNTKTKTFSDLDELVKRRFSAS